jgi:(1->4)-alpha-D-glucan 1-alpha-D-glucosylmutase
VRSLIENLFQMAIQATAAGNSRPEATYRLQFHSGFTFQDACRILPYLRDLGVTHVYASPYLKARPGSIHGYDILDHRRLNPEIGTMAGYEAFLDGLRENGLSQIMDIVANHMGILGNENIWWNDVLENGPESEFADYFDIVWEASPRPELRGRLLLPVLGEPYGKALEAGRIRLEYVAGVFSICYFEHRLPVAPHSYGLILGKGLAEAESALGAESQAILEYRSIIASIGNLTPRFDKGPARSAVAKAEKERVKRRLEALTRDDPVLRAIIEKTVVLMNGVTGNRHSFDSLDELLNVQAYRLSYWRVAADEVNYRRFFDVNELAALSMERDEVFRATHEVPIRLLGERLVSGLRIDHPDGLFDPKGYLDRLQHHYVLACARRVFESDAAYRSHAWDELEGPLLARIVEAASAASEGALGRPLYVIVEKILGAGEQLPSDWPTDGTTGYDFLNMINGLFVETGNADAVTRLYRDFTRMGKAYRDLVYEKKFLVLQVALASELHMLAYQLDHLAQKDRNSRDFTLNTLRHALREVIACFPVYRSYISGGQVLDRDRGYVAVALRQAKARNAALGPGVFEFVGDMLLLNYPEAATEEDRAEQRRFVGKFEQVTAPVMAKGLEDTTFYLYNRLVSLNEVGGDPSRFGSAPGAVHRYLQERQSHWPWAFSALSTHDTKRSEDVRARINVLSELPEEWSRGIARWRALNEAYHVRIEDEPAPDPNEEYFLYQTLVGAWPLPPFTPADYQAFVQRIQDYMVKALHEAKEHSSWINPNRAYEDALHEFVARILDQENNRAFLDDFQQFQRRISDYGLINALAQTLLKVAAPGVPDTYQGTELWDFSLVDPDNRRPVDYERRRQLLDELRARRPGDRAALARELLAAKNDGRIKLWVLAEALRARTEQPRLFTVGEYVPLQASGTKQAHVFGFARRDGRNCALAVAPRLCTRLYDSDHGEPCGAIWEDTCVGVPDSVPSGRFENVFTGQTMRLNAGAPIPLTELFADFPIALLLERE